jgi:hypothetical protein
MLQTGVVTSGFATVKLKGFDRGLSFGGAHGQRKR